MPDETKPQLPKRPYKKNTPKKTVDQIEHDCSMLTVIEKACVLIAIEKDPESAAIKLDMTIEEVRTIMDSAPVRLYLAKLQEKELTELARLKVRKYRELGINRAKIEQRLMELAMMDPSETKGNVDGQVKALAVLADKFGYAKQEDPLAGKSPDELKLIVRKGHALLLEGNAGVQ
jgi:hypothetical protein